MAEPDCQTMLLVTQADADAVVYMEKLLSGT